MRWTVWFGLGVACSTPAPQAPPPVLPPPASSPIQSDSPPAAPPMGVEAPAGPAPAEGPARAPEVDPEPSPAELERALLESPASLGSLSIGSPNQGGLFNGVQLVSDQLFAPVDPHNAWGTEETLDYLRLAAKKVHGAYPDTPPLYVGHISRERGGRLAPHASHQSGRDVDVGFYYRTSGRWYRRATADNLDFERTWTFVRALITECDVEMILVDRSLAVPLRAFAAQHGETDEWLDSIFEGGHGLPALVRHAPGHRTHLHVRFYNPRAQEQARRVYPLLVKHELFDKLAVYRYHQVKKGETLGKLAKRYGTSVRAIQRANGLRTTMIEEHKRYKIPGQDLAWSTERPLGIPARRLPPERVLGPEAD